MRYLRTLRHLRWSQLCGQVRERLAKRLRDPAGGAAAVWALPKEGGSLAVSDPVPAQRGQDLADGTFTFIGMSAAMGGQPDWAAPGMPRLWQYNLHYFDWLWSLLPQEALEWETAKRLTLDWIERHPSARNACGWEPYPSSLRLINWALLFGVRHRERLASELEFRTALLESVGRQTRWLEQNLETHIQANHLLENIAALICVASVFQGGDQKRLLTRMVPMLARELAEQVLPDGMHYERSPMYHLRVLWLMEMLSEVGTDEIRQMAGEAAGRMQGALRHLRHPDGDIAHFNDAAIGIYHDGWRGEEDPGPWALPDAGYYGFRSEDGDYLIIDAGPIGPDHQPGHSHADFFSFELSLGGHRIITDTGIGTYDPGPVRLRDRSTAAHSTVEVAGEDSVEVWGSFRVGRRVKPRLLRHEPQEDGLHLEAEHDGYRHLPCRARHRRAFEWQGRTLVIRDAIELRQPVEVVSRIHLAPGVQARLEGRTVACQLETLSFQIRIEGPGEVSLTTADAHPTFGAALSRTVIEIRYAAVPPLVKWEVWISRIEWK